MSNLWESREPAAAHWRSWCRARPCRRCSGTPWRRADRILMRQKELGIWQRGPGRRPREAVREIGDGLLASASQPGDCASILANTVVEWVLADLAVLCCGGVSSGIYPTDAAAQAQYLCEDSRSRFLFVEDDEQLDKALEVRERLPLLRKIIVFDIEGPARFQRSRCDRPGGAARAGPHPCPGAPGDCERARGRPQARRPGDPDLHLGHHRPAQGRDALARRADLHGAGPQPADRAGRERRAHVLPAAVPRRRAHGRRVLRAVHRRGAELRREPGDRARERARDRADGVHRRAAGVGEVLFGGDHRDARVQPAAAAGLRLGHRRGQPHGRPGARAASRSAPG